MTVSGTDAGDAARLPGNASCQPDLSIARPVRMLLKSDQVILSA